MAKKKKRGVDQRNPRAGKPLLSVCMIVKDEAADLERCLKSVCGVADEIIVVDTGSSDGSAEIARRNGAKVFYFEWCDDFSAARNAALAQATGRWVLQIDADEELTTEAAGRIRRVIAAAAPRCGGFYIPEVVYYTKDGALQHNLAHRLLLFRNSPDLRYRYRIHENIMFSGPGPAPDFLFADDLQVIHHGYLLDENHLKEKQQRNHRLLRLAIADNPADPFLQFNLGKHYYGTGRIAAAVEPLQRAVKLCQNSSAHYLASAYTMLVVALSQSGHEGEVPAVVAEAERRLRAPTADFFCSAGSAYQAIGQPDIAHRYFHSAIRAGSAPSTAGSDPAAHTWRPRFGIGFIHEAQGRLELARECYEEALAYAPTNPILRGRAAATTAKLGQVGNALDHIGLALASEVVPQETCWELLEVCENLAQRGGEGAPALASLTEMGGALVKRISPTEALGAKLSGACARFGEYELGIAAANATLERREDAMARANRGFCYFSLGRYSEAADDFAIAGALGAPGVESSQAPVETLHATSPQERDEVPEPRLGVDSGHRLTAPVSIIIPVFNRVELTRQCLEAVAENTPEDLYEVVMVDDGSTDGTKVFLDLLSGDVKVVTNAQSIGYCRSCEVGAAAASGKYLVFLSNDVRPRQGWLESAIHLAESDPSIGVIGTRSISSDGMALEAGGRIYSNGSLARFDAEMLKVDPWRESVREVDFCSPAGFLIRANVWQQTAGFDPRYDSNAYRVADLCMAVRKAGFRVLHQPASVLVR